MTVSTASHWYLDALDARGGLAFASYRPADLGGTDISADLPAVFVEPPHFRVVHVPNRTLGLAASRRTFQLGMFLDGEEVPFGTLDDVVEFARRCYMRSAGGDGPDSTPLGGGPPIVPPDRGPDILESGRDALNVPPRPDETVPGDVSRSEPVAVVALIKRVNAFLDLAQKTNGGNGHTFVWDESRDSAGRARSTERQPVFPADEATSVLADAALQLMHQLLRRFPDSYDDVVTWQLSARSLGACISRVGATRYLENLVDASAPRKQLLEQGLDARSSLIQKVIQHAPPWPWPWPVLVSLFELWPDEPAPWAGSSSPFDSVDALSTIPLPPSLVAHWNLPTKDGLSLADFLSGFLGSPDANASAIGLALFAACSVVSESDRSVGPSWWAHKHHAQQVARLAQNALHWIQEQLPRRAFSKGVEEAIRQATDLGLDKTP
jgi:hypothetical protein